MIKKLLFISFLLLNVILSYGQTIIKLKKDNGIYLVPCKLNGIDFELYFDTGASLVSISLKEANKLVALGKLSTNDIIGKTQMTIANGKFVNGTIVLIKDLKIGDLLLHDIETVIIESQEAPLLLGQSAIKKFNEFSFDYNTGILTILKVTNQKQEPVLLKLRDEWKKITSPQDLIRYNDFYKHRTEILNNMTVEVAKYEAIERKGETTIDLSLDITNNSDYDFIDLAQFKAQIPKKINIIITLYTEEGKIYTETVRFGGEDLPARNTNSNFNSSINIRNNKLNGVKIRIQDSEF